MNRRRWRQRDVGVPGFNDHPSHRLVADGGEKPDDDGDSPHDDADRDNRAADADRDDLIVDPEGANNGSNFDRANVDVTEAGETEPVDPKWEKPDPEDIPEFEVRADQPRTKSPETDTPDTTGEPTEDTTAGMPNTARSPGGSRIKREGTEGYIVALELCARLPDDVRLPEQAADLVPAAVEAELEEDVQSFAAAEFDTQSPTVDVLDFVERDGDVWLRLRLGIPPESFADLDPEAVRSYALQELDGLI